MTKWQLLTVVDSFWQFWEFLKILAIFDSLVFDSFLQLLTVLKSF